MKKRKKRNLIVNKGLQGRLAIGYVFFAVSGCLCFFLVLAFFLVTLKSPQLPLEPAPFSTIFSTLPLLLGKTWPYLTAGAVMLFFSAIAVTHRIAGPMLRFERTLELMQQGVLTHELSLRANDEGHGLAKRINDFNQRLKKDIRVIESQSTAISELLKQISETQQMQEQDTLRQLDSILWTLGEKNRKILSICDSYTIVK